MVTTLSENIIDSAWGDIKQAGQNVLNKTIGRAKGEIKGTVEKLLPQDGMTTVVPDGEPPVVPGTTEQEPETGTSKMLLYVAGAAVIGYLIFASTKKGGLSDRMEITVERPKSGGLLLSTIAGNQFYKQRYFDYSVKEAKKRFREYVKEESRRKW